jgi:hypothetical protein
MADTSDLPILHHIDLAHERNFSRMLVRHWVGSGRAARGALLRGRAGGIHQGGRLGLEDQRVVLLMSGTWRTS